MPSSIYSIRSYTQNIFTESKNKTYLLLSITLFFTLAYLIFAIRPTYEHIVKINSNIEKDKVLLAKFNDLNLKYENYEKQNTDSNKADLFSKVTKNNGDIEFLIMNLDSVVTNTGFKLSAVSLTNDSKFDTSESEISSLNFKKRTLILSIVGNGNFDKLVDDLVRFPVTMNVSLIGIAKSNLNLNKNNSEIAYSLQLVQYY